jgi:glutathione synthase/RimK-type ligase-like ATP-grasp enzyme
MTIEPHTVAPHPFNSQARHAAMAAEVLGWTFVSFPETDGYLFKLLKDDRELVFGCGTCTPFVLNSATAYSLARDKVFTNFLLSSLDIPVVPTEHFFRSSRFQHLRTPGRELADAMRYVETATFPIFCKPNAGSRGDNAEIVSSPEEFETYLKRLDPRYDIFLIQPVLWGPEYRVIVLNGRPLCFYEKSLPALHGDGVRTVRELTRPGGTAAGAAFGAESHTTGFLFRSPEGSRFMLEDVPQEGATVAVFGRANRAAGALTSSPSRHVPAALAALACTSAARLGLEFAAVDLKYGTSGTSGPCHVLEVNSNPGLETLEEHGQVDLIAEIWRHNIERALQCQPSK